jgi:hypothetical protein
VSIVSAGSLMTVRGATRASQTPSLTRVLSSVTPPAEMYSAADRVVGTAMCTSSRLAETP